MSEIPARVWWDPHDGRLQVTIEGSRVQRIPELRHANLRVEWAGGSWAESSISVPKKETTPARTRQAGNLAEDEAPVATLGQLRAYLEATGWEKRPAKPPYTDYWHHPSYSDYPDDGMVFYFKLDDPDPVRSWGILEGLATDEGRCEHEILADILGQPDTATLLKRIATLESQLEDANDELEFLRPRATEH